MSLGDQSQEPLSRGGCLRVDLSGNKEPQSRCPCFDWGSFDYALPFPAFLAGALVALRGAAALAFFTAFIMNTSFPRSVAFD
jgi:hypothetical protein